nr:immunoglobulin heavy chain junction region [Macaca mulatta]MOV50233.1 immunoglobulin heavy chain junction region [Macaca mulatta]MOV51009.1 immunoglobulin heavy chain junction region [Macaca mulatta]MOV51356.1 immunoglobulin heavy chain junction region [Macaca mulatta]MOV52177.1 immunoglobulin heavy chain junction region [Macaca mulatta]
CTRNRFFGSSYDGYW